MPGSWVYAPAAGTVLAPGAGQTLAVTFTPTDSASYTSASATVTITVLKATPLITWPTPAAILVGTPLGAAQLNATANVPGTFVYTPPSGTVLGVGAGQTLSVTLTPTQTAYYNTATKTVQLTVTGTTTTVPNVVGLTSASAKNAITAANLTVGAESTASSTSVPAGAIISQNPAAGTLVLAGSAVALVTSSGASVTPPTGSTPYGGTAAALPGIVQAEEFQ